jgi:hypothetical protein
MELFYCNLDNDSQKLFIFICLPLVMGEDKGGGER